MSADQSNTTIHASAVLCGARAVLIRGPAGAGKSRLALALIDAATSGLIRFARLIADDRVHIEPAHGRLIVRSPAALSGLVEVRLLGIRRIACEPAAIVGLVVDLAAADAERLPTPAQAVATLAGIAVPRVAVAAGCDPFPSVIAALRTQEGGY
jgi:serine kinase of HPr protein (carbohydrate metabolism regulator)